MIYSDLIFSNQVIKKIIRGNFAIRKGLAVAIEFGKQILFELEDGADA